MASFEQVAEQFTNFYYQTFDGNRAGLSALYRDNSMLTFEGSPFQGTAAITERLTNLPFKEVKHEVTTRDAQPTGADGTAILVVVSGALVVEGSERPMAYVQTFHLLPEGGSYYVYNDVFRLVYPPS